MLRSFIKYSLNKKIQKYRKFAKYSSLRGILLTISLEFSGTQSQIFNLSFLICRNIEFLGWWAFCLFDTNNDRGKDKVKYCIWKKYYTLGVEIIMWICLKSVAKISVVLGQFSHEIQRYYSRKCPQNPMFLESWCLPLIPN